MIRNLTGSGVALALGIGSASATGEGRSAVGKSEERTNADDPALEELTTETVVSEFEEVFGRKETSILLGARNRFERKYERRELDRRQAAERFLSFVRGRPQLQRSAEHFTAAEEERADLFEPADGTVTTRTSTTEPRSDGVVHTASGVNVPITRGSRDATSSIGSDTQTFTLVSDREMGEFVIVPLIGSASAFARLEGTYEHTRPSGTRDVRIQYFRRGNTCHSDTSFVIRYRNRDTGTTINRIVDRPNEALLGESDTVTVFEQFRFERGTRYDIGLEVRGSASGVLNAFSDYATVDTRNRSRHVRVDQITVL